MEKNDEIYYSQQRREMLEFVTEDSKNILEIGCGKGVFFGYLKKNRNIEHSSGIELDNESAEKAREVFDEVLVGTVESQLDTLSDKKFDTIICNDVLEHLVDPYSTLKRLRALLSDNGEVVVSLPNVRYLPNLIELLIKKDWEYKDSGILDRTHLRFFTKKSMVRMFEEAGYEVKKIQGINGIKSWKFKLLNILFFGQISDSEFLQFAVVAIAKKK